MNKYMKNEKILMALYDMLLDETKMAIKMSKRSYYRHHDIQHSVDPIEDLSSTVAELASAVELILKRLERIEQEELADMYDETVSTGAEINWKEIEDEDVPIKPL